MTTRRAALALLALLLLAAPALAADRYVLDGGTSSACLSWADACDQMSTAEALIARGETIWVGDGTYGAATLNVADSGTTPIYVKKATPGAHGTETGWSASYGDGQAVFSGTGAVLAIESAYWTIDGVSRTTATSGHGIVVRMTSTTASNIYGVHLVTAAASNTTLRYVEVYHADPCTAYAGDYRQDCLRSAGTGYASGVFRLARATDAGDATVGATYAQDSLGSTRGADGVWDRGAFEFSRPRGFKGRAQ